jgi:uncharacterized membrane protein YphA (DoxX/SURF4 family)
MRNTRKSAAVLAAEIDTDGWNDSNVPNWLIGHRYWTKTEADRVDSMDGFYKNLSIMGGFLLLHITGAGRYSIDALYVY